MYSFVSGFFCLTCLRDLLLCVIVICFHCHLEFHCVTNNLFIHSNANRQLGSFPFGGFKQLLQSFLYMLRWTYMCTLVSISVGWYMPRSSLAGVFGFSKWCQKFSRVVVSIYIITSTAYGSSDCCISLPSLSIFPVFHFSHSSGFVVVLHMVKISPSLLDILLWSVQVFYPCFLLRSFYILDLSPLWSIHIKYTLSVYFKAFTHFCQL